MKKISGTKVVWYRSKWVLELISTVPPILAASFTAYKFRSDTSASYWMAWLAGGAALWLVVGSLLKVYQAFMAESEEKGSRSHEGLYGAIKVVHAELCRAKGLDGVSAQLRLTVHRVVPPQRNPTHLEQLIKYVGRGGGQPGRRFAINQGIVGRAARSGSAYGICLASDRYEDCVSELIRDWGYTDAQAKDLTSKVRSYLAIPFTDKDSQVMGVFYADSYLRDFFDSATIDLAGNLLKPVVSYIDEKYR